MKKLVLLFFALVWLACHTKPKAVESAVFVEQKLAQFIDNHPEWTTNETTEAEVTDKFKHKAINWSNEADFLKNMPLQLQQIVDTTESEQAVKMAHFTAFVAKNRSEESLLNYLQLHIKGLVSEAQIKQLQVGGTYILKGNLQRQGKRADVKLIKSASGNTYHLGRYTFLITGFKAVTF